MEQIDTNNSSSIFIKVERIDETDPTVPMIDIKEESPSVFYDGLIHVKQEEEVIVPNDNMPKKKEDERKKRKGWCPKEMARAIEAVREKKMGYLKASKEFHVPRASLFRLVNSNEKSAKVAAATILGRKPVFSKEMEDELQKCLVEIEGMFHGLTKRDVCSLAYQLAVRNNIAHPFKDEAAGKDWFYAFMKRNPKLSVCKTMDRSTLF